MARRRKGTSRGEGGGPKSAEGKAVVRLNPVKHGIFSQTPVIPLVEREEDWERLRDGVWEHFEVEGPFEESLATLVAGYIWRMYRVMRLETESVGANLRDVPRDYVMGRSMRGLGVPEEVTAEVVEEIDRLLALRLPPGEQTLAKVMRYEATLNRQLAERVQQLVMVKALRLVGKGQRFDARSPAVMVRKAGKRVVVQVSAAKEEGVGGERERRRGLLRAGDEGDER